MASSSCSFKENTAPPIVFPETAWNSAAPELNYDAASYHPDDDVVALPPPPLLLGDSSEFYTQAPLQQHVHVSSASHYNHYLHQYLTGCGEWGHSGGVTEHLRRYPWVDSFYPRLDFCPEPDRHHNPYQYQYQRHHQHRQHQHNPFKTLRATSGIVLPTSSQQGEQMCDENEHARASAANRRSPNPKVCLTQDYENDDKPASTGEAVSGSRSVFATATNIAAEKKTHSETQSKSEDYKPDSVQDHQEREPRITVTIAAPTTKADWQLENSKTDLAATATMVLHSSSLPTETTGYVYDGTLEPLKSIALGMYESSSLWSSNPPWAGLFGEPPNYAAVARTNSPKCTTADDADIDNGKLSGAATALRDTALTNSTNTTQPPRSVEEYERTLERFSEHTPPDAAGAEAVLREMLRAKEEGLEGNIIHPTESCYNSVVYAYRRARQPHHAERILRLMVDNDRVQPTSQIYLHVIRAWMKSKRRDAPEHCEHILREMYSLSDSLRNTQCKPTVSIVARVVTCWAESEQEGGAQRAATLLQEMKTRFLNGEDAMRPELHCYSVVLAAFARESNMDAAENTMWEIVDDFVSGIITSEPRARDLSSLLSMYARDGTEEAVQHAECGLARFRELHEDRWLSLKPDGHTIVWLKLLLFKMEKNESTIEATNLLWFRKICMSIDKSLLPNTALYISLIESSAFHGDRDAAYDLFLLMIDEAMDGNKRVHPDNRMFEMIVSAYAGELCQTQKQRPDPRTAEFIMRRVEYLSEKLSKQYAHLHPRLVIYEILIAANCNAENAKRADSLLWECINKKRGIPSEAVLKKVEAAWKKSRHPDQQRQLNLVKCFTAKNYGSDKKQSSKRT